MPLYGLMLLRLQRKEVSPETGSCGKTDLQFLAMLAAYYKQDFNNEPEL